MNLDLLLNILVVAFFIGGIGYLLYKGQIRLVKRIILGLVIEAEKVFIGKEKGVYKYHYVVSRIYPQLPSIVRFFITEQRLDEMIEECVDILKEWLQEYPIEDEEVIIQYEDKKQL